MIWKTCGANAPASRFPRSHEFIELFGALADFIFPRRCLLCGTLDLPLQGRDFCRRCFGEMVVKDGPQCLKCGMIYDSTAGGDHVCSRCRDNAPLYDMARSMGVYDGMVRTAVHRLKYHNKTMLAGPLGDVLSQYGARQLPVEQYGLILPVPLHSRRLRRRGFNQSLLLAKRVGRQWGVKVCAEGLVRHRWTDPQTMLSGQQRHHNVKGAFSIRRIDVKGKKVLLVDDVLTSGSTVNECAGVLKKHGAVQVDVLTLAGTR